MEKSAFEQILKNEAKNPEYYNPSLKKRILNFPAQIYKEDGCGGCLGSVWIFALLLGGLSYVAYNYFGVGWLVQYVGQYIDYSNIVIDNSEADRFDSYCNFAKRRKSDEYCEIYKNRVVDSASVYVSKLYDNAIDADFINERKEHFLSTYKPKMVARKPVSNKRKQIDFFSRSSPIYAFHSKDKFTSEYFGLLTARDGEIRLEAMLDQWAEATRYDESHCDYTSVETLIGYKSAALHERVDSLFVLCYSLLLTSGENEDVVFERLKALLAQSPSQDLQTKIYASLEEKSFMVTIQRLLHSAHR